MKRIIIVSVLLITCIWVSGYSIQKVDTITQRMQEGVSGALDAITHADADALDRYIFDLAQYWDIEEDRLRHLVRRAQIDDITKSIAKLEAFTATHDYSELISELTSIRWQAEHLRRGEQLNWRNLL